MLNSIWINRNIHKSEVLIGSSWEGSSCPPLYFFTGSGSNWLILISPSYLQLLPSRSPGWEARMRIRPVFGYILPEYLPMESEMFGRWCYYFISGILWICGYMILYTVYICICICYILQCIYIYKYDCIYKYACLHLHNLLERLLCNKKIHLQFHTSSTTQKILPTSPKRRCTLKYPEPREPSPDIWFAWSDGIDWGNRLG